MALSATLHFGNNQVGLYSRSYAVVECKYRFNRHHNFYHPDTDARCDKVTLTLIAPGKDDLNLYEWYIDQSCQSGKISFDLTTATGESASVTKELFFEDAVCFSIAETYDIDIQRRRLLTLEIVADHIEVENVAFKSH